MPSRFNPLYNGRSGLYPGNKIENFPIAWNSSWGPTPNHWYDASALDFTTDLISTNNMSLSSGSIEYINTKNGLSLANGTTASNGYPGSAMTALHTSGSFTTTHFIVMKVASTPLFQGNPPISEFTTHYDPIPGDTGPGGGGAYNVGEGRLKSIGTNIQYSSAWSYTGTYPSQTVLGVGSSQSTTDGSFYVFKLISNHTSSPSVSGVANGITASSTTIAGGVVADSVNIGFTRLSLSRYNDMAEVICYDSTLSSSDSTLVENYLKSKWAIAY